MSMEAHKKLVILSGVIFLAIASIIGIKLVRQSTNPPEASTSGGAATLTQGGASSVSIGQTLPITLALQSPEGITGVSAVLNYTFSGTNPLTLTESLQSPDITGGLPSTWTYNFKEVKTSGNTVTITIQATYGQGDTTGYTGASSSQTFATLNFTAASAGSITLNFDANQSAVYAKTLDSQGNIRDILSPNLNSATYTVNASPTVTPVATNTPVPPTATPTTIPTATPTTIPTATIGPSATPGPTNTPGPTLVPTLTPLPGPGTGGGGPSNSCGGTCGSNYNCNAGLYCKNGYCRNPFCDWESDCSCKGPTATPSPIVIRQYQYVTTYVNNQPVVVTVYPTDIPTPTANLILPGEDVITPTSIPTPTPKTSYFWTLWAGLNKYLLIGLLVPILLIIFFAYQLAKGEEEKSKQN